MTEPAWILPADVACPCGRTLPMLETSNRRRCECTAATMYAYCSACRDVQPVARRGEQLVCGGCQRPYVACPTDGDYLVEIAPEHWRCFSCRVDYRPCSHRGDDGRPCGGLLPDGVGRRTCGACGKTVVDCPTAECGRRVACWDGEHDLTCEAGHRLVVCAACGAGHPVASATAAPAVAPPAGDELAVEVDEAGPEEELPTAAVAPAAPEPVGPAPVDPTAAPCPACGAAFPVCPTPGCGHVLPPWEPGRCTGCGEAYRLCGDGRCRATNRSLAGYCRRCGRGLTPPPSAERWVERLGRAGWRPRLETLGWVHLEAPFEAAHRKHVRGLSVGGDAWFCLPGGQLVGAARGLTGGDPVRLLQLFGGQEFAERRDVALFAPGQVALDAAGIARRFLIAASSCRIGAVAAEDPETLSELLDVRRQLGEQTRLVGGPVRVGERLLAVTRETGSAGELELHLWQLSAGRRGAPELAPIDRRRISTGRKLFLGPVRVWDDQVALLTGDELLLIQPGGDRLEVASHPFLGPRGIARSEPLPVGTRYFEASHAMRADNPTFTGERLVFAGCDPAETGGAGGCAFYEVVRHQGQPLLVRTDRGIPESEVAYAAFEQAGQAQLIQIWGRRPHVYSLRGNRRALDHEAALDQLGRPVRTGEMLLVRRVALDGFDLFRIVPGDLNPDLALIGRIPLEGALAVSDPVPGADGFSLLVLDPEDARRVGILRVQIEAPVPAAV